MKASVHQHGKLELYSVGDIEPVEFVVLTSCFAAIELHGQTDRWTDGVGLARGGIMC